jgi:ribosome-binding factor A
MSAFGFGELKSESWRPQRLENNLLDEIQTLLREEAADPALAGIHLVSLTLSGDGGHARIGYAVAGALSAEREIARRSSLALARATGFLRARLAAQLDLKRIPGLTFTFIGLLGELSELEDWQSWEG